MKYRKKQVVIEAFKLNSRGLIGEEWFWDAVSENRIITYNFGKNYPQDAWCEIKTLEGVMVAKTGDYIIQGVEGEIYPCKPDIFEKTYEVASQQSQLDDNQKIVLEWLKEAVRSGEYEPMHAISHLHTHVNLPTHYNESPYKEYYTLNPIGEIRVLMAFAQWGLEQEEAE